jgi:hypothetical protein
VASDHLYRIEVEHQNRKGEGGKGAYRVVVKLLARELPTKVQFLMDALGLPLFK